MKYKMNLVLFLCFLTIANIYPQDAKKWDEAPESVKSRKYFKRAEWFFRSRSVPFDTICVTKLNSEYRKEKAKKTTEVFNNQWQPIGPIGIISHFPSHWGVSSGRVRGIDVHPTNPNIVYIGAASGGLWKTTNGGESWTSISENFSTNTFGAIAIDPVNPSTVYAGTGEALFGLSPTIYYGDGIYKSTDAGLSWMKIASEMGDYTHIGDIVVNPHNNNLVFAALSNANSNLGPLSNTGVWRSSNGGLTWSKTLSTSSVYDLEVHPTDPGIVYAAVGGSDSQSGFYISTDQGLTWVKSSNGLPSSSNIARIQISLCKTNPLIIYSVIFSGTSTAYKSTNGGVSWSQCATDNPLGGYHASLDWYDQGRYDLCIAVNPDNPDFVLVGNVELHRMTDGNRFSVFRIPNTNDVWGTPVHCDYHKIVFAPSNSSIAYIVSDGGIFKSTDTGATWKHINNGIATIQFYCIASHPTNRNFVIGGAQDNGNFRTLDRGTTNYELTTTGDGMRCFFDHSNPQIVYWSTQYGTLYRSSSNGTFGTNSNISPNYGSNDSQFWTAPFFMHPTNPSTIYVASKRLWKSQNSGGSWTPIGNTFSTTINSMEQNRKFPEVMILSAAGNYSSNPTVAVSTNEGSSWETVSQYIPGPTRYIPNVKTDPNNRNTVYVVRSGFGSGKLYKSTDLGKSWSDISGDLPDIPHNDLVIDPKLQGYLYTSNDFGVYQSTNGGINWFKLDNGMPIVPVFDLDYVEYGTTRLLRAGTYGMSAYEIELPMANLTFINLLNPYGGADIVVGSKVKISWLSNNISTMNIYVSKDNKVSWQPIVTNYPADSLQYTWLVSHGSSDSCFIKLEDSNNPNNIQMNELPFSIKDLEPPVLVNPQDGITGYLNNPAVFNWQETNGTDLYTFQVSEDSSFNNILYADSMLTETELQLDLLDDYKTYYWRVGSRNELFANMFSGKFKFKTVVAVPQLLSPENNSTGVPLNVEIKWGTVTGAESYNFQLSKSTFFHLSQFIVVDSMLTSSSLLVENLQNNKSYYWRVRALSNEGDGYYSSYFKFQTTPVSGVEEEGVGIPDEYVLLNNYPNPFNPSTRIRFGIPEASLVTFTIFDGMGNEVIRNTNRYEYGGYYELMWNGKNSNGNSVSSGVYFYRIEAKSVTNQNVGFSKTAKMLLLK